LQSSTVITGEEKYQDKSGGDYAHEAKFDYGKEQLAGEDPFLMGRQNQARAEALNS